MKVESDLSAELEISDSVSVNGVCQTVIEAGEGSFVVEVMPETLKLTTLGNLEVGEEVNLEPSLKLGDKLGGHFVFGHVDGVGEITASKEEKNARLFTIKYFANLSRLIAYKGSISVDGISLTVIEPKEDAFTVSIVTHTFENTNLKHAKIGTRVNLEVDMLARYVDRISNSPITKE